MKKKHLKIPKIQHPVQAKTLNKFGIEIYSLDLIKDDNENHISYYFTSNRLKVLIPQSRDKHCHGRI